MHPHTAELLDYLGRNRAALRAAVDTIPATLRERRPAPERWSVAEVLEHLGMVEHRVTDRLAGRLASAGAQHADHPDVPARSAIDASYVAKVLDRSQRFMTPEAGQPRAGLDSVAAWAALDAARAVLLRLVEASDGLALEGPIAPHPLLGPLTFRQWVVFVGSHDARHAAQIQEFGGARSASAVTALPPDAS